MANRCVHSLNLRSGLRNPEGFPFRALGQTPTPIPQVTGTELTAVQQNFNNQPARGDSRSHYKLVAISHISDSALH